MSDDVFGREASAYEAFARAVAEVPLERREDPVLHDGWSVKDVLWHVVYWWRDGVTTFLAMHAGTFEETETTDEQTDVENARVLEESRAMSLADVEGALTGARTALLEAFAPLATDPAAVETFVSETIEHYEEHLPALRGFAEG